VSLSRPANEVVFFKMGISSAMVVLAAEIVFLCNSRTVSQAKSSSRKISTCRFYTTRSATDNKWDPIVMDIEKYSGDE